MKNFKRVLSAVVALAISASTFVAVSASKFSDVDDTNAYVEAINVLTSLGIVNGFEDGTFKPDGEITRAQAATMIVGALNMTADADAAKGTTKFDDMNNSAKEWASGYVNVGVAQGFIAGMDDKTFAPDKNVTYAQMCVMLTKITGYGEYAASYGGYPTGFTTMAASAGINKGVAVAADANLKRGQVAQMIYNALTAPLLGVKEYNVNGNNYAKQDGTNNLAFKTLLADKFEGYEADVQIEAVPKSDDSLNTGEVKIALTKDAYLEVSVAKTPVGGINFGTVIDEVGVADYLFIEGKAIIRRDDNDRWHLLYFKPNELDKAVVKASDYVAPNKGGKSASSTNASLTGSGFNAGDSRVSFGSKSYSVNSNFTNDDAYAAAGVGPLSNPSPTLLANSAYPCGLIYVNGHYWRPITEVTLDRALSNAQGDVTLIDNSQTRTVMNTTTGTEWTIHADGYELVMVNAYDVARVDAVTVANGKTIIQVTPSAAMSNNLTTIRLSDDAVADGDVALTVKNAAGEDVALSSIKKGDIIAYAIEVTNRSTIEDPSAIDIVVTDEKVSGTITRDDPTEGTYSIGDTVYECVDYAALGLTIGTAYTMMLDPFGRIYDFADVEAVADKYAIAETYNTADDTLKLILPDGTTKSYELSINTVTGYGTLYSNTDAIGAAGTDYESYLVQQANNPQNRAIRYTVKNSTGKISSITRIAPAQIFTAANPGEYKDSTNKLGNFTIGASTNAVRYNATDRTYSKFATSSFKNQEVYEGAVFTDAANFGNTALLVVLTRVGKDISADTRFAVVRKAAAQSQTPDGDRCYSVSVLYDGEEKDMLFDFDVSGAQNLIPGDAFFFKTDSEGLVNAIYIALRANPQVPQTNPATPFWFGAFHELVPAGSGAAASFNADWGPGTFDINENDWDFTIQNAANKDNQLVYGVITNVNGRGVEFALNGVVSTIANNTVDVTGDGNPDPYNYDSIHDLYAGNPNFTVGNCYDANGDHIVDGGQVNVSAGQSRTFGLAADAQTYRYAINENVNMRHTAIIPAAPTQSPIAAYETARNSSIYNLTTLSDNNGQARLTYALALIVNGDIKEIYTITQ